MIVVSKCRYFIVSFCKNEVYLKYIMKYIRGVKAVAYVKNGIIYIDLYILCIIL